MKTPEPCIVVIFGASGDLTQRKLFPALHNLQVEGLVPRHTAIVGTSRTAYSDDEFRTRMRSAVEEHSRIPPTDESWAALAEDVFYVPGDVTDGDLWARLKTKLEAIDESCGTRGNRVWYLATMPDFFGGIAEQIGKSGLLDTGGWHQLVVEKPFGLDLDSARDLNANIARFFAEDQVFRIDHYLGKETVQNLLVFRFSNAIFEPIWNRRYVDNVQITVAEDIGIEERAAFYERVGALRDVGQNHLLQLLALVAMEPPVSWDADAIRNEKVQVLKAVKRLTTDECADCVVRGQYNGYRATDGVADTSSTETFFAARFAIDNWRWAGVPFYVRTGKALARKATEISIQFQDVPHLLFSKTAVKRLEPNVLTIRIQPNEGISLWFGTKIPGPDIEVTTVDMEFDYASDFGSGSPEAYERLLLDCMIDDRMLFTRADEIEEAWAIVEPILEHWRGGGRPGFYAPGSWGPAAADELLGREGRRWRDPQRND